MPLEEENRGPNTVGKPETIAEEPRQDFTEPVRQKFRDLLGGREPPPELIAFLESEEWRTSIKQVLPSIVQWAKGKKAGDLIAGDADPNAPPSRTLEAVGAMEQEMRLAVEQAGEALASGNMEKARQIAQRLSTDLQKAASANLPPEVIEQYKAVLRNLDQAGDEKKSPEDRSKLYRFACTALDFVPVAGPAKQLVECAAGKTLGGDTLEGWKRALHGIEGAVFLAIDLTAFGAVGTKAVKGVEVAAKGAKAVKGAKAMKGGVEAGKLLKRTAAFLRVSGAGEKVYRPLFKLGKALVEHPELGRAANRGLQYIMDGRKARMAAGGISVLKPTSSPS